MARSIWKGSIAFGLVNITVSLTSAESRPDIQLHMVDSKNHARIRYERVNANTGEEVPWDRLVKGYEHDEGQFILLTEDDMEAVRPELTKTIEITRDGSIRQGSFVALREDKPADEVHLDAIATTGTPNQKMKVAVITITHPDRLVYPADGITKMEVARYYERVSEYMLPHLVNRPLALLIRDFLAERDLHALVKTSGGKGLHLVLFIKRTHDWESMREFSKAVAREVAAYNPSRLVITSSKKKRRGKIFIDWMRNGGGSTCIAPGACGRGTGRPCRCR